MMNIGGKFKIGLTQLNDFTLTLTLSLKGEEIIEMPSTA